MTNNPLSNPDIQAHFDRKKRRAMVRMAQACRLDPKRWGELAGVRIDLYDRDDASAQTMMWDQIGQRLQPEHLLRLWNEVSEAISGGVPDSSATVEGDPFATFLTGTCNEDHDGKGAYKQTAVIKTGHRVDQAEGERQIAYLKSQANVNKCELCGKTIHTWQADHTRMSTFRAQQMEGTAMATIIRGSDA